MLGAISRGGEVSSLAMPSFDDEQANFGDVSVEATIARYRTLAKCDLVVKNGAKGCTLAFADQKISQIEAEHVSQVIDTTSAGDSFNGAFLARYLEHRDPVAAAQFAVKVASRVIGSYGALVPIRR